MFLKANLGFYKVCSWQTVHFDCSNVLYKINVNLEMGFVLFVKTSS